MLKSLPGIAAAARKMGALALPEVARFAAMDPIIVPVRFAVEPVRLPDFAPQAHRFELQARSVQSMAMDELTQQISSEHVESNRLIIEDRSGRARLEKRPSKRRGITVEQSGGF